MARNFILTRYVDEKYYYYLVKNRRIGNDKWERKYIKRFDGEKEAVEYAEKNGLKFPTKRAHKDVEEEAELDRKITQLHKAYISRKGHIDKNEELRRLHEVEFTYHTDSIEGSSLSRAEVYSLLVDHVKTGRKEPDDYIAAQNQVRAIDYIFDRTKSKRPPAEEDFKKIQITLVQNISSYHGPAGDYRKGYMRVGLSEHKRPSPNQVPKLMKRLAESIKENWKMRDVGELIASSHVDFESIHPFSDRNGRTGRLIMNLILLQKGYPPIIIERKHKTKYWNALERSYKSNNDIGFRKFVKKRMMDALEDYLRLSSGVKKTKKKR